MISPDRPSIYVNLGAHPPRLWPEDREVVGLALRRLEQDLHGHKVSELLDELRRDIQKG